MNLPSRRQFLRMSRTLTSLGIAGGLTRYGAMNAHAQANDYKALVCVFLFGGNDSDNMLVPVSEQYGKYSGVRGSLAIPRASLLPAFTSGAELGFHPSMAPVHPLWAQNKMAAVANVGMLVEPITRSQFRNRERARPTSLFSHSNQQQQWQTGEPQSGTGTGWAGRTADRIAALNAPTTFPTGISVAGSSTLLLGQSTDPANLPPGSSSGLDGSTRTGGDTRDMAVQEMLDFPSGFVLIQEANRIFKDGIRVGELINSALEGENALQTVFPQNGLGQQLAQIARIIAVRGELGMRRQIFFCSTGGYDTHSDQAGRHNGLLAGLSASLAAFHAATVELGIESEVTTFTESEFGRTFEPNSRNGTDHAWGTHQLVIGGAVNGGQLYGRFPDLTLEGPDDSGDRGRWIPTLALDQFASTLGKWFGLTDQQVLEVFPNMPRFAPLGGSDLGFMG